MPTSKRFYGVADAAADARVLRERGQRLRIAGTHDVPFRKATKEATDALSLSRAAALFLRLLVLPPSPLSLFLLLCLLAATCSAAVAVAAVAPAVADERVRE